MDEKLVELAARYLGVDPGDVIVCRVDEAEAQVTVVVNPGPEYYIPVADLVATDAGDPAADDQEEIDEGDQNTPPDATDAAIALADEEGIVLETVTGTGKDGKITVVDVREVIAKRDGDKPETTE